MPRFTERINLSDDLKQIPISELIENAKSLIKGRRYPQSSMCHFNKRFNDLHRKSVLFNAEKLTENFIAQFIEEGVSRNPKLDCSSVRRKSLLNLIAEAVNATPVFTACKESDAIQNQYLREHLSTYENHLIGQDKSKETVISYLQTTTKFLLYLESINKHELSDVTAIDIREFITELGTNWSLRSMRIVPSQLKTFLKFAEAPVNVMLHSSIRIFRKSKPVRAMSTENVEALWRYVEGNDEDLRAKAILAILLTTGMRPVDITKLELGDINWNNDSISFVQSKTGEGMNIRLFPIIGSTIARYMLEQRPKTTGENCVFLSKNAPYRRLSPSICNTTLKAALVKAGVTFVSDGYHCPRAVRRSLVSRMIAKGVPVQKAAASIGHVDEKSTDLYTELDVIKMRSICLPIPNPMKGWCMFNG